MDAVLLPNGNKKVPVLAGFKRPGLVVKSTGYREITPDDPEFDDWKIPTEADNPGRYADELEAERKRAAK